MASKTKSKTKAPAKKAKASKQHEDVVPQAQAAAPIAEDEPKAAKMASVDVPTPPKKLSAIDAAVQVLGETGQAMNCQQLIQAMGENGYWTSPGGKTPASTLYASILRELKVRGAQARFQKTERGKFALNARA